MIKIDRTATLKDHIQLHHHDIVERLIDENEKNIRASIASLKLVQHIKREVTEFEKAWPVTLKMRLLILGMR